MVLNNENHHEAFVHLQFYRESKFQRDYLFSYAFDSVWSYVKNKGSCEFLTKEDLILCFLETLKLH